MSKELIVWQDISKQLIGLVKQVLKSRPSELDESAIETLVQPYLKQIEQDVENRLRQVREDEQARVIAKATKNWEDKSYSDLHDRLQRRATLKIGEYESTCDANSTKWPEILPRLGDILPEFAGIRVVHTPAQFAEFPRVKKFLSVNESSDSLKMYRKTVTIEGVPPNYQKAFIKCSVWEDVVNAISSSAIPMTLETRNQLLGLRKYKDNLSHALGALEALLSKRQVRSSDIVRFFLNSADYSFATCGSLATALKSTSSRNIDGQHHTDLLRPPQRRPFPAAEQ